MSSPSYADFVPAINHFSQSLLDTAVRSLLLLCLVSLAVRNMRRASAATRHWAWLMGIVGLLALPLFSAVLPGWRVLPSLGRTQLAESTATPLASPSDLAGKINLPNPAPSNASPQNNPPAANNSVVNPSSLALSTHLAVQPLTPGQQGPAQTLIHRPALPWTFWLALAWLVGVTLVLAHLLLGCLSLWLLERRCVRIHDGEWHEQLNRLRRMLGVRRAVELFATPDRTMPMTWGIWKPKLILPREADNWPSDQRKDVLLHELAHIQRFDCGAQLLVQIACALYWFNPLVWIAWNRIQVERERACDDIVLNTGAAASTYARHLLQSATAMPMRRFVTPALAMARPSTLESRLRTILDSNRNRNNLSGKASWATLVLLLIALIPVAALHAQENPAGGTNNGAPFAGAPATRPAPAPGGGRMGGRGGFGGMAGVPPKMGEGPTCAFDATIYDVRLSADKIGLIDPEALDAAADKPADFEKALAELGSARPLYHAVQTVRLTSDTITIGTEIPFVSNTRTDTNGRSVNSIQYQQTGAIFTIAGKSDDAEKMECDVKIQLSTASTSSITISSNTKSPIFRATVMSHEGTALANKPFVVLSADAASTDEDGKAVVYIARIKLGPPE